VLETDGRTRAAFEPACYKRESRLRADNFN
jgi:hypothetical protein